MKNNNKILAIIPARGGSKGIRNKNLYNFNGKPLIEWTINEAKKTKKIDRVIVSTENKKIAQISKKLGAEIPFIRPKNLAKDSVHACDVILNVINWLKKKENYFPEAVIMLLPTCPLRKTRHISEAISMYKKTNADSVIGVLDIGKNFTNLRYKENEFLSKIDKNEKKNLQRQGLKKIYSVNGSIFLANTQKLLNEKTFHMKRTVGYEMEIFNSIDINNYKDLYYAKKFSSLLS
jgi:N-acylneuraminate cytidylyltransferase/CMP-N,N'-diacetyllegionaminic acid synthase